MKYRIHNIKVPVSAPDSHRAIAHALSKKLPAGIRITGHSIWKRSVDARKRQDVHYVYSVDFTTDKPVRNHGKFGLEEAVYYQYTMPSPGESPLLHPPIVCGFGPAGLFAALILAEAGYCPLVIERGCPVEERKIQVRKHWQEGILDPESNVQFGEGGAGTFSDGKLTTQIKNPRSRKVLEVLAEHGASEEILYDNKPHIGTDVLSQVIVSIRKRIQSLGGKIFFSHRLTDLMTEKDGTLKGIEVNGNLFPAQVLTLAVGHSARDTFALLKKRGVAMEQKPFAVGVRIEHLQKDLNITQYGDFHTFMGAADYKITYNGKERVLYSFCMCPGGLVINAATEPETIVTNGMSFHSRRGRNANSALLVNVNPQDFGSEDVLAGVGFQRSLEQLAFRMGGETGYAPVQLVGDFLENRISTDFGRIRPTFMPGTAFANFREALPDFLSDTLAEGLTDFGKRMKLFSDSDAVITGIETRSSSPVRILRRDGVSVSHPGLYPAGEGAGYAGGIVSAAVDGIVAAEAIIRTYQKQYEKNQYEETGSERYAGK